MQKNNPNDCQDSNLDELRPGDKVRVRSNPGKVGMLGNETDGPPGRLRALVTFFDGDEQFILKGSLEKVDSRPPGPYSEISKGRYGRVEDLRGIMTFYRLNGRLANLIYSLNTTNTQFLPYQFKPVLHFLDSPCNGILIADEVGLGKTIEAGLIWTEVRARMDAKRLLVICPSMLREKWKFELEEKFGVKAEIVGANELIKKLIGARDRTQESFCLIGSIQGLRPPRGWNDKDSPSQSAAARLGRFLDETVFEDVILDMVVIDEAHYLRNRDTQNNRLGALLRSVTNNLVMLSATPIQMRSADLFNLLHILDEDAFPYEYSFDYTLKANAPIVALRDSLLNSIVTREKFIASLKEAADNRMLDDNEQIDYLINNPPSDEDLASAQGRAEYAERLDRINPLAKVVTRTLKRDVQEFRVEREPVALKVKMSPVELTFYQAVTDEVREFCYGLEISTGFMLTTPQRQMSSCIAAACRGWKEKINNDNDLGELVYEVYGETDNGLEKTPKLGTLLSRLVRIAHKFGDYDVLKTNDSKYKKLRDSLKNYWGQNPGKKVVLFSFFRHTLRYLSDRLREDGIASVIVQGGMDKQEAINHFSSQNGPDILLSSEVASEGVDLQFSSLLINYDLPWNPMKIEQRIGRIDRIGQEAEKILIWNLVYEDTIDDRIYDRLLDRLDIFKQALGSTEEILGEEIRNLGYELLSHKLTPEQEYQRINRASIAIENNNIQQKKLESEAAQLIAHGEYIQNKVRAASDLGRYIRGEDLRNYVCDFLYREYSGTRFVQSGNNHLEGSLTFSTEARMEFSEYLERNHLQNLTSLQSARPQKLFFENKMGRKLIGVERITQEHPIVRFVADQLNKKGVGAGYSQISAVELPMGVISGFDPGVYVYAIDRWTVTGSRDIERLEFVVYHVESEKFTIGENAEHLINLAAMSGHDWLGAGAVLDNSTIADYFEQCRKKLELRYQSFLGDYMREDRDRIRLMTSLMEKHMSTQRNKIIERINRYREHGTDKQRRLIPAEEGKLKSVTTKLSNKIEELLLKERASSPPPSFVSGGVVRLQ